MNIQKELIDWAKETVEIYNPMAQTTGLGYYTQSILNRENLKPELLILGINPGEFRESITITGSELLQGNPCFKGMDDKEILYELSEKPDKKKRRYGWDLWKKVFKLLNYSQKGEILRDLDRFVISNMIFFGTENEGQIPREIDSNKCAQQTLKLIDILKPKVVLLLGTKSKSLFETVIKTKLIELESNNLSYCRRGDSIVFAIKHTSRFYSNAKLEDISPIICSAFNYSTDFEEIIRMIPLKQLVNSQDSNQRIDSKGRIVYTYWCNNNGNYKEENGTISIGVGHDKDDKYILSILTKGNHPEDLLVLVNDYCDKAGLFKRDNSLNIRYIADAKVDIKTIAKNIEGLLSKIKSYREKDYPQ